MASLIWILLPLFVAAGSALLSFYVMQAKLEIAVAKERESLAEAQAAIRTYERLVAEKVKAAEESTLNRALDQFLGDIHVEERHYMRENRSSLACRKSLVLQERLYFRNIPLSNWVEHEMLVENNGDPHTLAQQASVFGDRTLASGNGNATGHRSRLLRQPAPEAGAA